MTVVELRTPYTADGLRWTNFFNGRLLAGDDLGGDQRTTREAVRRLGEAVGGGVAWGLEVAGSPGGNSVTAPTVTVQPGLAVNARGQTLALANPVQISLLRGTGSDAAIVGGAFGACEPPQAGVYVAGAGVYVLVMAPVQTQEGRAPVSGLGNAPAACASRFIVDGVVFRLVQLRLTPAELADGARLRNHAAHRWFGDVERAVVQDPFGQPGAAPELARLTDLVLEPLTDRDVPLAFIYWTSTFGIVWVDEWAARRLITAPEGTGAPLAQRRRSRGLAMWLQFQDQLGGFGASAALSLAAIDAFGWLPPLGILPLGVTQGTRGFDPTRFFAKQTTRGPLFIEGARLGALIEAALAFPRIELRASDDAPPSELIWLYFVRENREPLGGGQPYVVFARGDVPYQADPRFDVSHFDYANTALEAI